jgi:hypothetical protein
MILLPFGLKEGTEGAVSRLRLKQEDYGKWSRSGYFWITISAAILAFSTYRIAGVAAQYLPGNMLHARGTVTEVRYVGTPRTPCRVKLTVSLDGSDGEISVCTRVAGEIPIGPPDVTKGDRIILNERKNAFGLAVESLDYADVVGANDTATNGRQ